MKLSETDINTLLADLSGNDAEKREKAQRYFAENKADILPQLSQSFYRELILRQKMGKWSRFLWCVMPFLIMGDLLFLLFLGIAEALPPNNDGVIHQLATLFIFLFTSTLFGAACLFHRGSYPDKRQVFLLEQLNENSDPRLIGYLVGLIAQANSRWREVLEPLFYQQLRNIRPGCLSSAQCCYLRNELIYYAALERETSDEAKSLALLQAFQQIGEEEDYSTVLRVLNEGHSSTVRQAARECLPALKSRQIENDPYWTLVRASENQGEKDELLRAANSNRDTQAETLLRVPKE